MKASLLVSCDWDGQSDRPLLGERSVVTLRQVHPPQVREPPFHIRAVNLPVYTDETWGERWRTGSGASGREARPAVAEADGGARAGRCSSRQRGSTRPWRRAT